MRGEKQVREKLKPLIIADERKSKDLLRPTCCEPGWLALHGKNWLSKGGMNCSYSRIEIAERRKPRDFTMKHFILIVLVAFGAWGGAMAAPRDFPEHNCSITFPTGWLIAKAPPANFIVAGLSTNRLKTVALTAITIRPGDEAIALPQMEGSIKGLMVKSGQPVAEGKKNIGGVVFHSFSGKIDARTSAMAYTAAMGDQLYSIQTSSASDNAGTDADVQSVVGSFHLLNPVVATSAGGTHGSAAYRTGYVFGKILGIILIVGLAIWLITKLRK